jgi:hypothetical protein
MKSHSQVPSDVGQSAPKICTGGPRPCAINRKRNEMSLGIVPVAELSVLFCAAGIEIAQRCNPQIENLLAHQFGVRAG